MRQGAGVQMYIHWNSYTINPKRKYNVDGNVRPIFKEFGYGGNSLKDLTL